MLQHPRPVGWSSFSAAPTLWVIIGRDLDDLPKKLVSSQLSRPGDNSEVLSWLECLSGPTGSSAHWSSRTYFDRAHGQP
jgi:hypothetical protein